MTTLSPDQLDRLAIDTIRTLSIDGVQQANSGHPGAPMGMAPMAYTLWTRFLRHAPTHPDWPNRDRFVLSAGHASMLLYSLLHLAGYDLPLDELKRFRQWGSRTPGHPEFGVTPGVEATTGPLGQGVANAVGMAIAERRLAHEFNRPGHEIIDHWTYAICSDGDLQEGIASEAASLAGHLRLEKLVMLYDDNQVQLDGPTAMAFSEDVLARFRAYGWQTLRVKDGTDVGAIDAAIRLARSDDRPSIIAVRTVIGYGSPNRAGSQKAHGAPLGPDEVRLTKEAYGWDPDRTFFVPDAVAAFFSRAILYGEELTGRWNAAFERYRDAFPAEARELERRLDGDLAAGWDAALPRWEAGAEVATRNASADTINALAAGVPELFGGSADLSESNLTDVKGGGDFTADIAGRNLRFGVREHGMGGIANGIAYHGGFRPYVATFLDLLRLHARQRPHRVALRPADRLRLDPRLRGARRGRAHPPAGRALRGPARHPEPVVRPAGRRERDGGRLGAGPRADERADGAGADPPEAPRAARHAGERPRGRPARRLRRPAGVRRGRRRHPRPRLRRDRLGGPAGGRGRRGAGGRGDRDPRRLPPLLGGLRRPGRRLPRVRPPGRGPPARRGRDRRLAGLGALGRATRGRSSPSTTSARRLRPARSSRSSASRPRP